MKKDRKIVIYFIIFIGLIILACCFYVYSILSKDTFYSGTYINNLHVGGLKKSEAKELLFDRYNNSIKDKEILLKYKDKVWKIKPDELSFSPLLDQAIENAYTIGRIGNPINRIMTINNLKKAEVNINSKQMYNKDKLKKILSGIKDEIKVKGKDAKIYYEDNKIILESEIIGKDLDINKNIEEIEEHILKGEINGIDLLVNETIPKLKSEDISGIKEIDGDFFTVFDKTKKNRSDNITLACKKINNKLLMPGEVFSMDKVLGSRTIKNGYKEAPVIFNNELVEGIGGGVCQVTSTLYNTVLLSKLKVVERTHHTLPLTYVGSGRDATISEGYIDFKFENNLGYPILILAEVKDGKVYTKIVRKENKNKTIVKLKSEIIDKPEPKPKEIIIDNTIPDGKYVIERQEQKGLRVIVKRETYNLKGELVNIEKISDDLYKPVRAQVKVNEKFDISQLDWL